jgi:hypothetical protein
MTNSQVMEYRAAVSNLIEEGGNPLHPEWEEAARRRLDAAVRELMRFSYGNGWNDSTLDKGGGERFAPDASADSLLNEEPKDDE